MHMSIYSPFGMHSETPLGFICLVLSLLPVVPGTLRDHSKTRLRSESSVHVNSRCRHNTDLAIYLFECLPEQ